MQRRDELSPSLAGQARSALRACRDWVVAREWHARGRFGSFLRWLDRHLPSPGWTLWPPGLRRDCQVSSCHRSGL